MDDLEKLKGTSSALHQALCIILNPSVKSNWSYCPKTLHSGQNQQLFVPCDLKKTIGHIFFATLSFVHRFKAISEFKLELQSETLNPGQNQQFFVPCDLEIWWITLKSNQTTFLCCFKLCASFHSHRWIKTKVTVRKRSVRVKIDNSLSRVTLKFNRWPWKTIGHIFFATLSFVHHFKAIGEFKLTLQSGNAPFRSKLAIFCPVWPWKLKDDLEKQQGTSFLLLPASCIIP